MLKILTTLTSWFVVLLSNDVVALGEGNVGCLFSSSLCVEEQEWCFDDYAFGKCLPHYTDDDVADLFRHDLQKDGWALLEKEMTRLFELGYGWRSDYTQCVLQDLLNSIRFEIEPDQQVCEVLREREINEVLQTLAEEVELDPNSVARVKFRPSMADPHAEYADEIYSPLFDNNGQGRIVVGPPRDLELPQTVPLEFLSNDPEVTYYDKPKRSRHRQETPPEYLQQQDEHQTGIFPLDDFIKPPKIHFTEKYNTPDSFRSGLEIKDVPFDQPPTKLRKTLLPTFSRTYNTPDSFRNGYETRDDVNNIPVVYMTDGGRNGEGYYVTPEERQFTWDNYNYNDEPETAVGDMDNSDNVGGVYTEGGLIYLKDPENGEEQEIVNDLNQLGWGFKRRERLDVKKPGPEFKTNNYAFVKNKDNDDVLGNIPLSVTERSLPEPTNLPTIVERPEIIDIPDKKKVGSPMESPNHRKPPLTPDEGYDLPDSDSSSTYILFKEKIKSWQEGAKIVREVAKLLKIDPNVFTHTKCDENQIKFKVEPNRYGMNASEVAKGVVSDSVKEKLKNLLGVEIVSAGTGDKYKLPAVMSLNSGDDKELWVISILLFGLVAACIISAGMFFVIRKHSRTRDKLQNLSRPDTEASKDYQDLCRARMATKTVQEKPEGTTHMSQRIRESEGSNQSPSSRSSTSSWSEEPALTNMDISTGHMVLSYMEDHLKNKDRLEQEWVALCAYEAEPCATTVATKQENMKKNRYNDVLPYDHARVVLNELANASGSSYINASTITDHDPRNPAYIATQGPLPHTASDFWQMVWEQGSVVMVMLTRLTENGNAMCHRYWPEEGSELYHIYEVHLVSEHIWCDDYLVRSFYLKNVKTSETRTVTQFHFLSWPENGVPLSTKALLEFRRKVNKSYRGRSCPIIVHCSDGVGRSGTYCLIDMVLNRMAKGAKEIDIAATLEHIRDQRGLMVKTKQQFEFVLMAVAEEVHAILKALPANHSPPPVLKEKE